MIEQEMAQRNLIYKVRTGSHMYGTRTENSDDDFTGIFIPFKDYVMGLKTCEQVELSTKKSSEGRRNVKEDVDFVVYSLPKFIHLCLGNNPNIIELLYAPKNCKLLETSFSRDLILNRNLFLSKRCYHTFKGYAYSQRIKLEVKKENMTGRRELADKFGYDTKFASHLIRLLQECAQILVEKTLSFPRPQNNLVRDIKLGKYELRWVLEKADELEKLIDVAYIESDLQHSPDIEEINKLQIQMLQDYWDYHCDKGMIEEH
jgi:predicted nucleotidyltransferase